MENRDGIVVLQPLRERQPDDVMVPRHADVDIARALRDIGVVDEVTVVGEWDYLHGDQSFEEMLLRAMRAARLVLADIAHGDLGVLFRLGVARGLGKPTLACAHADITLPQDLIELPVVFYERTEVDTRGSFPQLVHALRRATTDPALLVSGERPSMRDTVFISYSHRDKAYLERLLVHLRPLERQGLISFWADTRLTGGERWGEEIREALKRARVAVLLVSSDFLDSEFILDQELPGLLARAQSEGTVIIPVALRPCRFLRERQLAQFQAINDPTRPLSSLSEDEREVVYDRLAERVERIVGSI